MNEKERMVELIGEGTIKSKNKIKADLQAIVKEMKSKPNRGGTVRELGHFAKRIEDIIKNMSDYNVEQA